MNIILTSSLILLYASLANSQCTAPGFGSAAGSTAYDSASGSYQACPKFTLMGSDWQNYQFDLTRLMGLGTTYISNSVPSNPFLFDSNTGGNMYFKFGSLPTGFGRRTDLADRACISGFFGNACTDSANASAKIHFASQLYRNSLVQVLLQLYRSLILLILFLASNFNMELPVPLVFSLALVHCL
ncbi:hypothetical protein SeLEV6574_g08667, partial [Synchytrium endobioticum]